MKKLLPNVTLIGIDCVNLERLQLAADISTKDISFGKVVLLTSIKSDDPRIVQIPQINSVEKYSDFMVKELYKYIDTEFALIFQYDGFILNPLAWSDDFLKYDYIGAPWYHLGNTHVGNGGFSLRSKKLIDWMAENWKKIDAHIHPEDVFISKFARPYLEQNGMTFAPEKIAKQFSKEGNERSVVWNGEFGFHGIKYTDISNWLVNHPEYKEKLTYELDDYATLMKKYDKYLVHDGIIHTFRFKKQNIKNYIQLSKSQKNYEAREVKEGYYDFSSVKVGDMIVFKRSGVSFENVPVPAFEKTVTRLEAFKSLYDLRKAYPKIHVTYPTKDIPKWKRYFIKILGDLVYPKNKPYTVFWFD
jgi:hypothetical protein